jgi:medium-chain acyl-[acyl-carrier-protein] hydrolase
MTVGKKAANYSRDETLIDHSTAWIVQPRPEENAGLRLICVPHLGGSSIMFRTWPQHLPDSVEVNAIELPGHGRRIQEIPYSHLRSLVIELADAILPVLDRPYALFGQSFGAIVCFELAREFRSRSIPAPIHLCVSGAKAPHLLTADKSIHLLPDLDLIEHVRRLGGTPDSVLENEELVSALLPAFRADYKALETYFYSEGAPFDFPLLVFGGVKDNQVDRASLQAWSNYTRAGFRLEMTPGDHYFIHKSQKQVLQILGAELQNALQLVRDG